MHLNQSFCPSHLFVRINAREMAGTPYDLKSRIASNGFIEVWLTGKAENYSSARPLQATNSALKSKDNSIFRQLDNMTCLNGHRHSFPFLPTLQKLSQLKCSVIQADRKRDP